MGTFPKKEANLSASMVAEVTTSFRSERRATTYEADERNSMEGTFMYGCGLFSFLLRQWHRTELLFYSRGCGCACQGTLMLYGQCS